MRAIRTEGSNFTYLGPEPRVADLPGLREDGVFSAVFEFTDEERRAIADGGQVRLGIWAEPIPPVSVSVVKEREAVGEERDGVPVAPDYRCERCDNLYVSARATELNLTCGWCGGDLRLTGGCRRGLTPAVALPRRSATRIAPTTGERAGVPLEAPLPVLAAGHTGPWSMDGQHYTEGEVIWLLSIDRETARKIDAEPPDSFPDLLRSNFSSGALCASDERPLLTVLRWHDVHDARERIAPLIDEDVLDLRLEGLDEKQVALVLERSQATVSRAWTSSVEDIVRELNAPQFVK